MSNERIDFKDTSSGMVESSRPVGGRARVVSVWDYECFGASGRLKWRDRTRNMVVDQGLNKLLGIMFAGSSAYSAWKVGLVSGSAVTPAAGWDYQGIGSDFTEATAYTGSRQTWTPGSVASQQVSNSGSRASFTISGSSAINVCGAFLCAGPNAGTKGNAAAGNIIYAISQFTSGAKALDPSDVLKVTVTLTAADA